ncbi:MAG TPA: TIGR00282 family metallophosphoesterase [bacterium]|nr:TIGR00282 family metallophosphoesterase [bacterium]
MLKILFIGDVFGKMGRITLKRTVGKLKSKYKIDLVVANADNLAHGKGVTESTLKEAREAGVDFFTNGDHAFDANQMELYKNQPIIRAANFPPDTPGKGWAMVNTNEYNILIINLLGRVFMKMNYDCPFRKIDEILANNFLPENKPSAIIIDIHAEATSEKVAFKHYVDGRVSAVLGTHTHIPTADAQISRKGTAFVSDVGMVGSNENCIGVDKEFIIKEFLTQISYQKKIPEKGESIFCSVLLTINPKTAKTEAIKQIIEKININ